MECYETDGCIWEAFTLAKGNCFVRPEFKPTVWSILFLRYSDRKCLHSHYVYLNWNVRNFYEWLSSTGHLVPARWRNCSHIIEGQGLIKISFWKQGYLAHHPFFHGQPGPLIFHLWTFSMGGISKRMFYKKTEQYRSSKGSHPWNSLLLCIQQQGGHFEHFL